MGISEWKMLLDGAITTLWLSLISIAIGVVVGLVIALIRNLKLPVIDYLLTMFVSITRATPLVTVVLFVFLAAPSIGLELD